jgi:CubicO group peptidase (beta-lactamase class C family)
MMRSLPVAAGLLLAAAVATPARGQAGCPAASADTVAWRRIDGEAFTLRLPRTYRPVRAEGVDSEVRGWRTPGGARVGTDYGSVEYVGGGELDDPALVCESDLGGAWRIVVYHDRERGVHGVSYYGFDPAGTGKAVAMSAQSPRAADLPELMAIVRSLRWTPRPRTQDSSVAAMYSMLEMERRLLWLTRAARIPGLAAVVLRDTSVVMARGFGWADVERQVPVTLETPFNVASVAKPISAVVALRLAADGVLDLDRPMRRFRDFAEFCDATRGQGGIFFADFACTDERLTLRHVLLMTANGEPGTRFWYNPPAFSWASRPMAEVAGRPFSDLVDSLVFRPAGMRGAARTNRARPLPAELAARLATPYHLDSAGRPVRSDPPPPQGDGAAGGVIASARDLVAFDVALSTGRLLAPEWREQLWTPTRTPSGATLPYGLGWFLREHRGRRLAWHTGLWEERYSALYLKVLSDIPSERLTLILLANSDALQWETRFDEAAIERSPFANAFLDVFPPRTRSAGP